MKKKKYIKNVYSPQYDAGMKILGIWVELNDRLCEGHAKQMV